LSLPHVTAGELSSLDVTVLGHSLQDADRHRDQLFALSRRVRDDTGGAQERAPGGADPGVVATPSRRGAITRILSVLRAAGRGQPYSSAMKILLRWLLLAAALLLVAEIYPGVSVASFGAAMIAALVLGLLNTLVRPILVLLTLPVTVLTLGLFLFVINALMFYFAAALLAGFNVAGFVAALVGSLLYSLCGLVIDAAMERLFARR
jgi:putative membrane protein